MIFTLFFIHFIGDKFKQSIGKQSFGNHPTI